MGAVELIRSDAAAAGCEKIAELRAGDLFTRYPAHMAVQILKEEADKLNADKVSVSTIVHSHPKLGKSYSGVGVAYKCGK